jgi:hypothetical protein
MKQAWGAGWVYESGDSVISPVAGSTNQKPCGVPVIP